MKKHAVIVLQLTKRKLLISSAQPIRGLGTNSWPFPAETFSAVQYSPGSSVLLYRLQLNMILQAAQICLERFEIHLDTVLASRWMDRSV
jgi:hypothetical protein